MLKNLLKNKTILITGVGKGLGYDFVLTAIEQGAFVYGITRSKKDLKKFKRIDNCKIYLGNVTNHKKIQQIFRQSIKDKRQICSIINNAGIRFRKKFLKINNNDLLNVFKINFFSIFNLNQIFVKYIIKYKVRRPSILNIGSIVGSMGFNELSLYASTKSSLSALTKCMAVELASKKIRVNILNPGFIKTSYYNKFKKKKKLFNWTLSRIPLKRWGEVKDVSTMACFLISDYTDYLTGEEINIDGGWVNS